MYRIWNIPNTVQDDAFNRSEISLQFYTVSYVFIIRGGKKNKTNLLAGVTYVSDGHSVPYDCIAYIMYGLCTLACLTVMIAL